MTGRRGFWGKEKEKAFVGLNVLLKVSLVFLCFLSVAKSISSVFVFSPAKFWTLGKTV